MYNLCPSAYSVSKTKDDFPEPDNPVTTVILYRGIETLTFFKLWFLAPPISILFSVFRKFYY